MLITAVSLRSAFALGDLADRGLIEKVYANKYAIVRWPESDDRNEEELL